LEAVAMVRPLSMDLRNARWRGLRRRERAEGGWPERRAVERGEVDAKAAGDLAASRLARLAAMCRRRSRAPIGLACRADGGGVHPARTGGRTCRRGLRVDYRTVWTFIAAKAQLQKKPGWRASKTIPASPASAGVEDRQGRIDPSGWSSS